MTHGFHNTDDDPQTTHENAPVEQSNVEVEGQPSSPEPPARWRPDVSNATPEPSEPVQADKAPDDQPFGVVGIGSARFELKNSEVQDFMSARRFTTAAQITAIVSLFFGGILLSLVAIACAFFARSKLERIASTRGSQPDVQQALRRSGKVILIVAFIALALNIAAAILLYPLLVDTLQSGGLGSLIGTSGSTGTGVGNATWG